MTRFLAQQDGGDAGSEFSELRALRAFHVRSRPWAEDSMSHVMGLIMHDPTLHMVQTLECLTLYWFGLGGGWKGDMCHGMIPSSFGTQAVVANPLLLLLALAYRGCRSLGYAQGNNGGRGENSPSSLRTEVERRCFWSCWTSMCIIAQPEPYLRSAWSESERIPLPGLIDNTPVGWRVVPGQTMTPEWTPSASGQSQDTSAFLVMVVGVW